MPKFYDKVDVLKKPGWLKIRLHRTPEWGEVRQIVEKHNLHTICSSGRCPNQAECWSRRTATFMILGDICTRGCRFCATGRQGLQHSLSTNEILNQIESLPERERLTNVVFMGMGEPLDNLDSLLPALEVLTSAWGFGWSPTRITVSTAGVASRLERFLEATQVHLAVSLHNPFPHERAEIMPIEKAWPIREVVEILRRYDFTHQRRVSFEYIVMSGLNDSPRHIRELCRLLDGIKCRINLIRFHKIPGSPYFSPDDRAMIAFRDALTAKGIHTTIRTSRGEDIQAACGLLSTAQNEAAQFSSTRFVILNKIRK